MTSLSHTTHCGLPGIDLIPFGMHACHVYDSREELAAALAPFFAAGLARNERCLWITAPPLPAIEAIEALRPHCGGVDEALAAGALRVRDFDEWRANSGRPTGADVLGLWLREEERALADGYNGLRIGGNMSVLAPADWPGFMAYERAVSAGFSGRRIVALCSYAADSRPEAQVRDVVQAHHCAFKRAAAGDWQVAAVPAVTPEGAGVVSRTPA